eukprot:COSAG06_NODE_40106_length_405_cov_1.009804_1_plen_33_part_10
MLGPSAQPYLHELRDLITLQRPGAIGVDRPEEL